MNRTEYLGDRDVSAFIDWSADLVTGKWGLVQCWACAGGKNPATWSCTSLYDAHLKYKWLSKDFDKTDDLLDAYQRELRDAIVAGKGKFVEVATKIWKWGGSNKTEGLKKLDERGFKQITKTNVNLLDPELADICKLKNFKFMVAGHSKVYSLLIDDFPIYDSRVACALTSLIWLFCLDTERRYVPDLLRLGVPPGRNEEKVSRNPSIGPYQFPNIRGNQYTLHARSNVKAAWILGTWAERGGKFSKIPRGKRIRSLEAALFMLGYKPLKDNAVVKTGFSQYINRLFKAVAINVS